MSNLNSNQADLLKVDEQNRRLAIDAIRSFIVEAPAGAGKTELLTQRFLALLLVVQEPEEIIALTFTNKAVAEMRKRVIDSLLIAKSGIPPLASHQLQTYNLSREVLRRASEQQWNLLENSGRLQVTTLDALCGKLVKQMPYLSRFGAQPAISTDASPLYHQASRATLELLEEEGAEGGAISRVLSYFDNDTARFMSLIESMLDNRDQWLRHAKNGLHIEDAETAFSLLIHEELNEMGEILTVEIQHTLMNVGRFAASVALASKAAGTLDEKLVPVTLLEDWDRPLAPSVEDIPLWRGLMLLLLTDAGKVRSKMPEGLGFSENEGKVHGKKLKEILEELKSHEGADEKLSRVRTLPSPKYSVEERQLIEDLYTILKLAEANLWLAFKGAKQVDFTQMSQNALLALGEEDEPTDLQLQLDYKMSHLLVDEFQDTSPTQVELLRRLTSGWQKGDGRTLFLVGDPMQSIYRFRKADVGLFLKVRNGGIGDIELTPLNLYRNNRSTKELVEWVNTTFKDIFPAKDDLKKGAVKFAPAAHTKGADPQALIGIHPIIDMSAVADVDEDLIDPAGEIEARKIISLITQSQASNPHGKIAVLVRARSHLKDLVEALRFHGSNIRYQAVEIESLFERQAIQDLVSLTKAMFHFGDRINWLAILRAPWCGLTLADLHALAADDHYSALWEMMKDEARLETLSLDGQKRIRHVREVLAEAFENQGRQRPRRWVEGVWQCLGGPLCLINEGEYQDVNTFFIVLDRLEYRGRFDLSRLEVELEKLFAAPDPSATSNDVQLMTIHKSKGLEFDTVILPGLHRKLPNNEKNLLMWDDVLGVDGQEHLVMAALSLSKEEAPSKSDFLQQFEKIRSANETQRLLYVAVTRAKRQLHLLGVAKIDKDGTSVKAPSSGACLNLLWNIFVGKFEEVLLAHATVDDEPISAAVGNEGQQFQPRLVRLAQPVCPLPYPDWQAPEDCELLVKAENEQEWGTEDRSDADMGTLVHRYLEFIAGEGLEFWSVTRIEKLKPRMSSWFSLRGYSGDVSSALSKAVVNHLVTTIQSEDGRWVLAYREGAGSEVELTKFANEQNLSYVIDRTFIDEGVRWIIDYKTAGIDPNGRVFAEEFRSQLERYKALYASSETRIKLGVFFTHSGRLIELE